jgi:hypothetical protein
LVQWISIKSGSISKTLKLGPDPVDPSSSQLRSEINVKTHLVAFPTSCDYTGIYEQLCQKNYFKNFFTPLTAMPYKQRAVSIIRLLINLTDRPLMIWRAVRTNKLLLYIVA